MIELTDEQASVLKQGYPVPKFVPELGGDVVVILATQRASIEDVRERDSRAGAGPGQESRA